jgi:LysR family glycine cleavage system transcriptional activator
MKANLPLKALICFEAAVRLNSFSLAADELCVTPGAVGQQIRNLEQWLGIALFSRQIRQVTPTAEGLAYWARIQPALAQIIGASEALRDRHDNGVWLTMPPSLAAKWFARRMSGFLRLHPDIELHLSSSTAVLDFARERVDLAIRHFDGEAGEEDAQLLLRDEARVYCSPDYAQALQLKKVEDLQRSTLLHNTLHPHWLQWLTQFSGMSQAQIGALPGIHFDQSLMAIEAARRGQGMVIASQWLVEEEIANGTLVEPFAQRLPLGKGYYLIQSRLSPPRPAVQALKAWLMEQAAYGSMGGI